MNRKIVWTGSFSEWQEMERPLEITEIPAGQTPRIEVRLVNLELGIEATTGLVRVASVGGELYYSAFGAGSPDLFCGTATPGPSPPPPVGPGESHPPDDPIESADDVKIWIDDSLPLPEGEEFIISGDGLWLFESKPLSSDAFMGRSSLVGRGAEGLNQIHFFAEGPERQFEAGDQLVTYVYVDPEFPPQMILLQWNVERWNHRAHWGANLFPYGPSFEVSSEIPEAGQWHRLEVGVEDLDLEGRRIRGMAFTVVDGSAAFDAVGWSEGVAVERADGPPVSQSNSQKVVWFDDELPEGLVQKAVSGGDSWDDWVSEDPVPVSGSRAHRSGLAVGIHQHHLRVTPEHGWEVADGDSLFADVYVDVEAPPEMLMLQWHDGTRWHRARWGENRFRYGESILVGEIPEVGSWTQLEVPVAELGLGGKTITGLAFTLFGGEAIWDAVGHLPSSQTTVLPASSELWLAGSLPEAVTSTSLHGSDTWEDWDNSNPSPLSPDGYHISRYSPGIHQHVFRVAAEDAWQIDADDRLFAEIFLVDELMPEMVMLQFHDGTGWRRARWGSNKFPFGPSVDFGALPLPGAWHRIEMDGLALGLVGSKVNAVAFTLFGGEARWGALGRSSSGGLGSLRKRSLHEDSLGSTLAGAKNFVQAPTRVHLPVPLSMSSSIEKGKYALIEQSVDLEEWTFYDRRIIANDSVIELEVPVSESVGARYFRARPMESISTE